MEKQVKMPFWDHVYELRKRLIVLIISIIFCSVLSFLFYPHLFNYIYDVLKEKLLITEITEGFTTTLSASITMGIFFSLPILLFEIILFIFPALKKKEKIIVLVFMTSAFLLFIGGVFFSYKSILPVAVNFFKSDVFFPENVTRFISYQKFIDFFFQFLIAFGICFQFPLVLLLLLKLGILKMATLLKYFRHFIVVIFIVAAVITPGPDVISQLLLAIPMIVLYLISIIAGKLLGWGK
jgi:sec-independent protein translocase protein TatC